jgi:hypothetical protein
MSTSLRTNPRPFVARTVVINATVLLSGDHPMLLMPIIGSSKGIIPRVRKNCGAARYSNVHARCEREDVDDNGDVCRGESGYGNWSLLASTRPGLLSEW